MMTYWNLPGPCIRSQIRAEREDTHQAMYRSFRPGLYGVHVKTQALRLFLVLIVSRQTAQLITALVKWPIEACETS